MILVGLFALSIIAIFLYNWLYHQTENKYNDALEKQRESDFLGGEVKKPLMIRLPRIIVTCLLLIVAAISLISTSVVIPSGKQVALLDRVFLCSQIKDGRNIALSGECGRQAKILMPGFKFSPFIRVLNKIKFEDIIEVPDGQYATLTARDGLKLEAGQVAAQPWPLAVSAENIESQNSMLDATYFLTTGKGKKGPQTTILTPGKYPINTYLWDVDLDPRYQREVVEPGFVGVIRSAIDGKNLPSFMSNGGESINCNVDADEETLGQLVAVTVPVGCRGVWQDPLPSGVYFLNKKIYTLTEVDTRIQNWTYKGGYTRRTIDLKYAQDGSIEQIESIEEIPLANGAAGDVIRIKVEGWTVYQELRIQARVLPANAPLMVAAVGNLQEVEDRIITPQVRSESRNIGGSRITVKNSAAFEEAKSELNALEARLELLQDPDTDVGLSKEQREQEAQQISTRIAGFELPDPDREVNRPTRVLDFQNEREAIEILIAEKVSAIGESAGIDIVAVALGNSDLPPEMLVARKVEQLSGQRRSALVQERTMQVQRQATEAAKARADKQSELVAAQIEQEASEIRIETRQNDGAAERSFLEEQAKGQEAQANVLGKDRVAMLKALQMIVDKPEIITSLKLPSTVVMGGGNSMEGAAAILGAKNLFSGNIFGSNEDDSK